MRRAPPKKGDQAIGRSRGGLTTKIHALVEGLGNLGGWMLTGGQAHDCTQACPLLEGADTTSTRSVTADKAYDTNEILTHIKNKIGAEAVIPSKANRREQRPLDLEHYKSRNLIERFFCRLKQFRRIATRYDKLASRFSAFIALVATFIWLA